MPTYRTKPVEIEAIQWRNNPDELEAFGAKIRQANTGPQVYDLLQDTWVNINPNDYIIRGNKGEYYPCEASVFTWKYELIAP